MKELTKAEQQVMRILWKLKEGIVKDILDQMPDPKPAYSTVSTVVRVLQGKGFINHKAYGNSHVYYPAIEENAYKHFAFDRIMDGFFDNSYNDLVSFLVNEKKLDANELENLTQLVQQLKSNKQ
jgi:BlaI family penicillinase repressor